MSTGLITSYMKAYLRNISPKELEKVLLTLELELSEGHFQAFQAAVRAGLARRSRLIRSGSQ